MNRAIDEALLIKESYEKEREKEGSYICMNAKMEFTRNILPGVSRTATEKEKKFSEDLTNKIMAVKTAYMKSQKGERESINQSLS